MTSRREDSVHVSPAPDAVEALLRFGIAMLRAGNTAARTHQWIEVISRKLALESLSVSQSLESIVVTVRRSGDWITVMREIGTPAVNVLRIARLEQLAKSMGAESAPREILETIAKIESEPAVYPASLIVAAVGAASCGFAFINGALGFELIASAIAGAIGHGVRARLSHNQYNQYAITALTALAASGLYVLLTALMQKAGMEIVNFSAGFMGSVLFLVPGFPLVGGLFDLLHYKTVAAVSRLAYGTMLLLAVAIGLSIVVVLAGIGALREPSPSVAYSLALLLRAVASFVAGCAFAMLFNSSVRTALAAGLLAMFANSLRLALTDMGMMLGPAAFLAALAIGLVAVLADRLYSVPRIAMTVAPTVIMMPGVYAFEMIVLFNRGQMVEALQASASCGFVIGALAMGLATARFFSNG
ncbi:MAG TPA: threonine/serine exporter family protein [Pseudolabrys sp.]|nr:threonine/serine exporter family protein [Pseudolabrys sp.]